MTTLAIGELTLIPASDLADAGTLTGVETVVLQRGTALPALRTSTQQIANLAGTLTTAALKANNLSDLPSIATARTNLGLGGAAVLNVGTVAGTVAAGDDIRLSDARNPNGTISAGDLAGSSYPSPTIAKINGVAIGANPLTQYALNSDNLSGLASAATARTNLGLGNVDNTSDATKNAATVTLTNKTLTSPVITTPTGIVKADVGLGNVDNTSDANKPVSSATTTQLNLKAPLASPTFTGTVTIPTGASITAPTGLVKGDVGLGNVDNTSNVTERAATATLTNKSISGSANTLTNIGQASVTNLTSDMALKAPLASPTFTGNGTIAGTWTVTAPVKGVGTSASFGGSISAENGFLGLCFIGTQYNAGTCTIDLRSITGASDAATTPTLTDTPLGGMHIGANYGTGTLAFADVAQFYCVATEDYTSSVHQGSRWDFYVNPNNSSSAKIVAFKIDQDSTVYAQKAFSAGAGGFFINAAGAITTAVTMSAAGTSLVVGNDATISGNLSVGGSIIGGGVLTASALLAASTFTNTTTNKYVVSDTNTWSATASQAAHATNTTIDSNPSFVSSGSAGVWSGGGFASLRSRITLTGHDALDNRWGVKFEDATMTPLVDAPYTRTVASGTNVRGTPDGVLANAGSTFTTANDVGAVITGPGITGTKTIVSVFHSGFTDGSADAILDTNTSITNGSTGTYTLTRTTAATGYTGTTYTPSLTNQYVLQCPTLSAASNNYFIHSLAPVYFSGSAFDASGVFTSATASGANTSNLWTLDALINEMSSTGFGLAQLQVHSNTVGPTLVLRNVGGSIGTPAKTPIGAVLGAMQFAGAIATAPTMRTSALLSVVAEEAFDTSTGGAGFRFSTGATGGGTNTLRMALSAGGTLYINPTITANVPTAGNATITQAGAMTLASTLAVTGHVTFEGVTSTGATGTGNLVFDGSPTFSGGITMTGALSGVTTLAMSSTLTMTNTSAAASIILVRNTGAAVATNTTVAQFLFEGARDASNNLAIGASITASSEAAYSSGTNAQTQLRFSTQGASGAIGARLVMDSVGTHHITPTLTSGLVTAANAAIKSDGSFFCGGGLTYSSNQPTVANFAVSTAGTVTLADAANIVVGSTTGTSLGTAITQKLSFYGVTPVVQRANANQAAAPAGGTGATAGAYDTAAHRDAHIALTNEIRTVLVNVGLMKGSA